MKTKIFEINLTKATHKRVSEFTRNGIIAPDGTFYNCKHARHEHTFEYVAIMIENISSDKVKKGGLFKDSHGLILKRRQNFIEIKDQSWLSDVKDDIIAHCKGEPTQAQINTMFDYDQQFGTDMATLKELHSY